MTAARDLVNRTTTPRKKVYEKYLCIFTRNSLFTSRVYYFERFQKTPFAILYEKSAEFQREKNQWKKKLRWKRKRVKTTITMLCCVLCDTIFDISWFKNLNSYAGYWISNQAMTSVLEKKGVLRVDNWMIWGSNYKIPGRWQKYLQIYKFKKSILSPP